MEQSKMERLFIGIDIGGTNLRCALVDGSGDIVDRRRTASRIEAGRDAFCERIFFEISELMDVAALRGKTVSAVGIGIPGLIGRDGLIHSSVNMQPLEGFNPAVFIERQTGLPTICANDANVIALGEQRFGAGRGYTSCMVITIGTGLGSGLILDNRIWSGSGGFAAEFGHVTVDPHGLPCPCGNHGCLEQYVSAGALVRMAREYLPPDVLADVGDRLDAELVAGLARNGEPAAAAAFDQLGYWLGTALASLNNTLNLEAVVIGGGVASSFDLLRPALELQVRQRCFVQIANRLSILKAELGDDAGLLGGAALAAEWNEEGTAIF